MNYLQHQLLIYRHALKHSSLLLRTAPLGWAAIWLFITSFAFISLLSLLILPIMGYLFLLNICFILGMISVAHELDGEEEYLYQNRTFTPFLAPFRADSRFSGFHLGLVLILAIILWGIMLHHLYPPNQVDSVVWLPNFLQFSSGKLLFFGMPILWLWFAPSYFIHYEENAFKAIAFSIIGCLKNGLSLVLLLCSFALPIVLFLSISNVHPVLLLPVWTLLYLLVSVTTYAHFCALYVHNVD